MPVYVKAICQTEKAVVSIAEGDAKSMQDAEIRFNHFWRTGECAIFRLYQHAVVVSVILDYNDYEGTPTQVLKIAPPDSPKTGPFGYVLLIRSLADKMRGGQGT